VTSSWFLIPQLVRKAAMPSATTCEIFKKFDNIS